MKFVQITDPAEIEAAKRGEIGTLGEIGEPNFYADGQVWVRATSLERYRGVPTLPLSDAVTP